MSSKIRAWLTGKPACACALFMVAGFGCFTANSKTSKVAKTAPSAVKPSSPRPYLSRTAPLPKPVALPKPVVLPNPANRPEVPFQPTDNPLVSVRSMPAPPPAAKTIKGGGAAWKIGPQGGRPPSLQQGVDDVDTRRPATIVHSASSGATIAVLDDSWNTSSRAIIKPDGSTKITCRDASHPAGAHKH